MVQAANIIPVWPFRTDWSNGYTETLEWKTTVLQSRSGAEQRYAARIGPRRKLELPYVVHASERAYFDVMVSSYQGTAWYAPLPHDAVHVGSVSTGQTTFYVDTRYREFYPGGHVAIQGRNAWEWDVLTISDVTDDSVTTVETPSLNYSDATMVPVFLARFSDNVQASRPLGRVFTGSVQFTVAEPTLWPINGRSTSILTLARAGITAPILTKEPNAAEDLSAEYQRLMKVVDNEMALPVYTDAAARSFVLAAYTWMLVGAEEGSNFRDLLFAVGGQRGPLWVPTFNDDLTPGATTYPNPNGRIPTTALNRELALAFNRDGTYNVFTVAAATSGALPSGVFNSSTVARVSFLDLKRFSTDAIEIVHQTDSVAVVKATLIDAPDIRVVTSYANLGFPNTYQVQNDGTTEVLATNPTSDLIGSVTITGPAGGS